MPSSLNPGQNIRKLAFKRRLKAITSFASAGVILLIPIVLNKTLEKLLKPISSLNPTQQQPSLNFPPILYVIFLIMALGLVSNGVFLWKRAKHAAQGAKGEEDIGREMFQLESDGWQIEYGMQLGRGLGDVDIVCISPQQTAYAIDVKSHRGEVTTNGQQLFRRMGKTIYPFEKDFLSLSMKQALQVKHQKKLGFVTPVLVFSDAKVSVPPGHTKKVYVVDKSGLVSLLRSLG